MQGEGQQRPAGVVTSGGHAHAGILLTLARSRICQASVGIWHTDVVTDAIPNPDDVLPPGASADGGTEETASDFISQPAKVMRIGSMVKSLLDEARNAPLDDAGRVRLKEIYELSVKELSGALSGDLSDELTRMALPLSAPVPSDAELRVAQAQLVGWLEGLFHGIQASLFAQQAAAQAQLEQMRNREITAGTQPEARPGTYL